MASPPPPPEVTNTPPTQSSANNEYIEIEIPASSHTMLTPAKNQRGCLWGCGGMLGCFVIVVGVLAGTVAMGATTVVSSFTDFFNLPAITVNWGGARVVGVPDDVYIPPVERVQSLSELTTTRYNYADVTAGAIDMPGWLSVLYGDSVAMVIVGTIEAGVDVSQITAEDITFTEVNQTLTVTLPAPVLQSCFVDESQSYVVRRDTAVFAVGMDSLEDTVRQNALVAYRDQAIEEGILADAEVDAAASLEELLSVLVNDESVRVQVIFEDPIPAETLVLPTSCQG